MLAALIIFIYVVGALITLKVSVTHLMSSVYTRAIDCTKRNSNNRYGCKGPRQRCLEHDTLDPVIFGTVGLTIAWPGALIVLGVKHLLFPRGVQTKDTIAWDREKSLQQRERQLREQQQELVELSKATGLPVPPSLLAEVRSNV